MTHDYQAIASLMKALIPKGAQRDQRLALFTEILWEALSSTGVSCWAVLDLDSHQVGAFTEADAEGLASVLRAAGLGR